MSGAETTTGAQQPMPWPTPAGDLKPRNPGNPGTGKPGSPGIPDTRETGETGKPGKPGNGASRNQETGRAGTGNSRGYALRRTLPTPWGYIVVQSGFHEPKM